MAKTRNKRSGKSKKVISARHQQYFNIVLVLFFVAVFGVSLARANFVQDFSPKESFLREEGSTVNLKRAKIANVRIPHLVGEDDFDTSAGSYLAIDMNTLSVLEGKNYNQKRPIASLTKLMTAVVALENADIGEIVTVKGNYEDVPPAKMGLYYGEKISLEGLLNGALINSDNDAAQAISEYIAAKTGTPFMKLMNAKAKEMGMNSTNFTNPMGLDTANNYSTAYDLALLANYAMKKDFVAETARRESRKIASVDGKTVHSLQTTNELLKDGELNILGLKTGSTPMAGGCLIVVAENDSDDKIITVVLGSADRFNETKKMIEWVWENIGWSL